ncbi:MAG: ATP-binding protein [Mucilaginibacter sp.]
MKKLFVLFLLFQGLIGIVSGQQKQIDSLNTLIRTMPQDTNKALALLKLGKIYWNFDADSGIRAVNKAYQLALANKSEVLQIKCFVLLGNIYSGIGDYNKGIQMNFNGLKICDRIKDVYSTIVINNNLGSTFNYRAEYKKALQYLYTAKQELEQYKDGQKSIPQKLQKINVFILENIGESYLYMNQIDSAVFYFNKGISYARQTNFNGLDNVFDNDLANIAVLNGDKQTALKYFKKAEALNLQERDISNLNYNYHSISEMYRRFRQPDSAIFYAKKSLQGAREGKFLQDVLDASKLLYKIYDEQHDIPKAYQYYKMATQVNDSINSQEKIRELLSLDFTEKQRQQEIAAQQQAYQSTLRTYLLAAVILFFVVLAAIFWRNNRQKQKANHLLTEQKEEISAQRDHLETALHQLKATQTQLIQSEKMASLGELTAGIAHEIQNPLNFVNNFSEVNTELIDEMQHEIDKGDYEEVKAIANDIKENQQKISQHGKRADFIVKGMLQHSRTSTGERQPTNINILADEFLKLAYHGLRAKDKNFNADLIANFDKTLPPISIVQQDIGRVLLNLFNNAFYAVNQKQKNAGADYKPEVTVSTSTGNDQIIIKVKDNGNGIPDGIKEKIMQPFFTTKPTGEGTGLGLSLSYDIVVKGHGGSITVNSKQHEGSEFMISIPINN